MTDLNDDKARQAERVMIDIISSLPGFKPPSQARSRETTFAIVLAATELLRQRSYGSIRMQDIAERAGCAVTAIYARFPDKQALLIAIHLLLLEEARPILDREIRVENFKASGLRGLADAFVKTNEGFFARNVNFLVAGIAQNDGEAYRITAAIMDAYAIRIAKVAAELMHVEMNEIVQSVKFAIHIVLSIYRDSVMGAKHFATPSVPSLSHVFVSIIEQRLIG